MQQGVLVQVTCKLWYSTQQEGQKRKRQKTKQIHNKEENAPAFTEEEKKPPRYYVSL